MMRGAARMGCLKFAGSPNVGKGAHPARGAGGPHLVNLYTIKLDS
jgi:hypothetical protein